MTYITSYCNELPKALDKDTQFEYLKRLKNGDDSVRNILIEHNIRLVVSIVIRKFSLTGYDLDDLVSIGVIGLIKAVDTYDYEKNANFATYSGTCINNEIFMYMRKRKKSKNNISLSDARCTDKEGRSVAIEEFTKDENINIEGDYERRECFNAIREEVDKVKKDNIRKIMYLEYGFDCEPLTQREISNVMDMSQSYVSRIISRETKKIGEILALKGIVEYKVKGKKKINRTLKSGSTVYEQFKEYTKEEVDFVISLLDSEELRLLHLRFGEDFNVPCVKSNLGKGCDYNNYYNNVLPKMKSLLKSYRNGTLELEKKAVVTADDYAKIIEFIDSHDLKSMFDSLDPKQAIILCLKLGYINNKAYSVKEIAIIMDAKEIDIIKAIRCSVTLYKDRFDGVINIDSTLNELKKEEMKLKKKA